MKEIIILRWQSLYIVVAIVIAALERIKGVIGNKWISPIWPSITQQNRSQHEGLTGLLTREHTALFIIQHAAIKHSLTLATVFYIYLIKAQSGMGPADPPPLFMHMV